MKLHRAIFWIFILFLSTESISQEYRIFTSLEEAASAHPVSVFRLDLSKNKLQAIPNEIYGLKNLRDLNLSQNKFQSLPDDFYLPNLQVLNLEKNDLDTFSNSICKNTSLQYLYMGRNDVAALPECIGNLTELIVLDIWFNPIRELPLTMTNMKKLRHLDLRGVTFSNDFQKKWSGLLPWVKIEFDLGCDCAN